MSRIFDLPLSFKLAKSYVIFCFKRYYGEFIVIGKENIPTDCPVIFAPNHTNALMDALAVISVAPKNLPVVFLARSDIFKNKKAAKFLNFAKIMPAFRMRDGVENLGRNQEIFDKCVEVLHNNKALGIMPEGNQEIERKLRPLVKGIFRIAFAAQQKYGSEPKVKIVPVGLDFGDIVRYGKHIIITIGKPIKVSDYMNEYQSNPVTAVNHIREQLRVDLCDITFNLASDKHYESFETTTEILNTTYVDKLNLTDSTTNRFIARQHIAEQLVSLEKNNPDKAQVVASLSDKYKTELAKLNLRNWIFESDHHKRRSILTDIIILIINLPLFAYGAVLNLLPFFVPVILRKKVFKAKFTGFFSSLQYAMGLVTFPLFYGLQTAVVGSVLHFHFWQAFVFILSMYFMGKWALMTYSLYRKVMARIKYRWLLKTQPDRITEIQNIRKQIIEICTNEKS